MRFMYWPNEPEIEDVNRLQFGGRQAFSKLLKLGKIDDLYVYPYRNFINNYGNNFLTNTIEMVNSYSPDILFVQHVTGSNLPSALWSEIRKNLKKTTIVYHDADPYSKISKRIDPQMKSILSVSDLNLVCGLGFIRNEFSKFTKSPVKYLPHNFPSSRFITNDVRLSIKTHDISMIGNVGRRRRLKFLYHPGGRSRYDLARRLSKIYGDRFALYGAGWEKIESNSGVLPFHLQELSIQKSRITVNWDHFDSIPFYFSDRLPISLAAGVPHITSYHEGYEDIFRDCPGLFWCRTPREIVDKAEWLLSKSDEHLLELGLAAQTWAIENLESDAVFTRAFEMSLEVHRRRVGATS